MNERLLELHTIMFDSTYKFLDSRKIDDIKPLLGTLNEMKSIITGEKMHKNELRSANEVQK